jgi:DNA (cytosine-5)-methyltransferase 1
MVDPAKSPPVGRWGSSEIAAPIKTLMPFAQAGRNDLYEFFCGGGMARAGLGTGWECLLANDNDPRKGAAYAANWTANRLIVGDMGDLTAADLPGVADLAWASPPCQDVSLAGDRAGLDAARSGAFWPFVKLMHGLRAEQRAPRAIVLENVTGLLTSHGGKDFDAVCGALAACDYRVGAVVIDAALFVPQSRERVFIIGVGSDTHIPTELVADRPTAPFNPPTLVAACERQRSAPIWWRLPVPPMRNSTFADIIEDEPKGVRWHTQAETDRLIGMMTPVHLAKIETAKRAGRRIVGGLYRRIRPDTDSKKIQRVEVRFDGLAGCLRMPTGGSSILTIVIVDGNIVRTRRLSAREAARLMGVGEDYVLPTNYREAYGLMADGVVVPVVRFLAEHIFQPILQASARGRHMIIRCDVCNADPAGRWKSPPAMIFRDPYREDGSARDDPVPACRDHLSAKREKEIQEREKDRGWKKGELR